MKQANKMMRERESENGEQKSFQHLLFMIFPTRRSTDIKENSGNIILDIGYSQIIEYRQNVLGFLSCLQSGYIKRVIYRQTNRFDRSIRCVSIVFYHLSEDVLANREIQDYFCHVEKRYQVLIACRKGSRSIWEKYESDIINK